MNEETQSVPEPHTLRELQLLVRDAVFDNADSGYGPIKPNGLPVACRLDVYRNNLDVGMTNVLRSVFPVIERLVGDKFFRYAAHEYIHRYPSWSGDVTQYGARFPDFLASFEPAQRLPYLADVATLQLAEHQATHAAFAPTLDLDGLQAVPSEQHANLQFTVHPSMFLVESVYPVFDLWQVNQPDWMGDQQVNLDKGGCNVLVLRPVLTVILEPITANESMLLALLATGSRFGQACELVLQSDNSADIGLALQHAIGTGLITGFTL